MTALAIPTALTHSARHVEIDGKSFRTASPVRLEGRPPLLACEAALRTIQAAFLTECMPGVDTPLNPVIVGPPGIGKTSLVAWYCLLAGRKLYILQGTDGLTADEVAVSARLSDHGRGEVEYLLSPLATAMLEPAVCLIDEIGKLKTRTLSMLHPVGDARRSLVSSLAGFSIEAHPGFSLIATSNSELLPDDIEERFGVRIRMQQPPRSVLDRIVRERFGQTQANADRFLACFWKSWLPRSDELPSPRRLIQCCRMALGRMRLDRRTELQADDVEQALEDVR